MATRQVQVNAQDTQSSLTTAVAGDDRTKHVCVEWDDTLPGAQIASALEKAKLAIVKWLSTR